MEQHPIPQQISSYEFKLVGDMTLNQFIRAALGIIVAMLLNSTKLVFFIKWPLMLAFGGGGLMLAFVPFEDRPLEKWLLAFIKSIYSPTIYTYKKKANKNWLDIDMSKVSAVEEKQAEENLVLPSKDSDKVREFIQSLPSVKREKNSKINIDSLSSQSITKDKEELEANIGSTEAKTEAATLEDDWREKKANLNLKTEKLEATGKAVFGAIPMPDIPEVPNLIVGMVTDNDGKIIEGAIIEIQDEAGNPSRVLKTNSLGQFRTSTQLANGKYLIICEKENFNFDRVNVDLHGEIVEPIKIQPAV